MADNNKSPSPSTIQDNCQVTKIMHITCMKGKRFDYEWTVKNFQLCHIDVEKCGPLESPIFWAGDIEWNVDLFPDGFDADSSGYLSVRLFLEDCKSVQVTDVYVEVCLVNKNGQETNRQFKTFTNKNFEDDAAVFSHFVKRDFLLDKSNGLLPNNELTIICRIFFNVGFDHDTAPKRIVEEIPEQVRLSEFNDFEKLLESSKFSDVKLVVGDKEFLAHKDILSARSRVFAAMFEHNMKEQIENKVEITDVDADVMQEVLRFIYAGKVNNVQKLGRDLLSVAEKYELQGLIRFCEKVLINDLCVENIAEMLVLVDRCYTADELRSSVFDFLTTHRKDLVNSKDIEDVFESLSPSLLAKVIKIFMLKL